MTHGYPAVLRYGDMDKETFEEYWARWPSGLSAIPKQVVEDWVYRHWRCFQDRWAAMAPHTWAYRLTSFTSAEILSIGHVGSWIDDLDAEGAEYVGDTFRARVPLALYMRSHGTFPVPIIVAENAGHVVLPSSGGAHMSAPLQLIEGHARLACLRGMIHAQFPSLQREHHVWLVQIP